ncbi:hypothetical protein LSTR_LSTR014662 [Laodelphax striatellus]|uniref:Uncharacterized protein n=1 Tax=Laodelphax striatellus TaxID=195883 RepID=A0A482XHV5_LAOST|nr:hypothetical protein LSTR_LSTR014662 [Laodelphax striatellus]
MKKKKMQRAQFGGNAFIREAYGRTEREDNNSSPKTACRPSLKERTDIDIPPAPAPAPVARHSTGSLIFTHSFMRTLLKQDLAGQDFIQYYTISMAF